MGFVKDAREGKVYLKDYDDTLAIHRAESAGFKGSLHIELSTEG